jgi:hypothetical protein
LSSHGSYIIITNWNLGENYETHGGPCLCGALPPRTELPTALLSA